MNRTVRSLVALGFALRLALGGCLGTIDMDWWKSWVVYGYEHSLVALYGSSDAEIAEDIGLGMNLDELRLRHARLVPYRVNYGNFSEVRGLWVAQPPLYVYSLMLAGGAYRLASGGFEDGRWFNFSINLLNLASAAGTAWLIYAFWRRTSRPELAAPTALAYWLNPLVLLNGPVQGYLDQLCAVFLVWSLIQLYERRLLAAYALFAVSLLMKPTGVVVLPLLVLIGLREHGFRASLRGGLVALGVTVLSFAPFLVAGQGLSVLVGLSQLGAQLDVVCRKAINLWYPVQYFALESAGAPWWSQFSNEAFGQLTGARVDRMGAFLFVLFTVLNLASCWKTLEHERWVLFSAAGLEVLASFVLRTGQHVNHYFLAIPLLAVVALTTRGRLACFVGSCALFFAADVIFFGFGRDTPQYSELLAARGLIGVTVPLAIASVIVAALSYRAHFPRAEPRRWLRLWLAERGIGSAQPAALQAGRPGPKSCAARPPAVTRGDSMGFAGKGKMFRPLMRGPANRFDPQAAHRPVLVFEDVHKAYRADTAVLRGLSLEIARGEFVFITGPSGAGKSTLLRLVYATEQADSGRILFLGREIGRLTPDSIPFLRRNIGVIFQDFKLVGNWNVFDNVAVPLEVLGLPQRTIRSRVGEALERVGLGGRGGDTARHLSGGEQQRVAVARAIVGEPAIVLADEPTGNLDPLLAVDILGLLEDIHATGVTVLFATHDRSLLDVRPRRVVVLDEGRAADSRHGLDDDPSVSGIQVA